MNDEDEAVAARRKLIGDVLAENMPSTQLREAYAIPQRLDQLEDAVMNLAKLYEELKRTLVANNIHPPMPGHASPADE